MPPTPLYLPSLSLRGTMMQSSWRGDSCGEKASVDAGLSLQLARILAYGIGHAGLGHGVI